MFAQGKSVEDFAILRELSNILPYVARRRPHAKENMLHCSIVSRAFSKKPRGYVKSRSGESYRGDFRAPDRSVRQYVSTGAQKIPPRRPPERLFTARSVPLGGLGA